MRKYLCAHAAPSSGFGHGHRACKYGAIGSGNRQNTCCLDAISATISVRGNRAPMQAFTLERLNTPTGSILIVTDDEHRVRAVDWEDHEGRMQRLLRLHYGANATRLR